MTPPSATSAAAPFRIAAASSLEKIRIDGANLDGRPRPDFVSLAAAGDEAESFQLVVVPTAGPLSDVRIEVSRLDGPDGEVALDWRRVEYVRTGNASYRVDWVGLWPDPLYPPGPFDVAAREVQPLWFTARVPPRTAAGLYTATVAIHAHGHTETVPVRLRVRNFTLPRPGRLATPFGLYQWMLAEWYAEEGESVPIEVFARWCRFLAEYRLTPKNIGYEYLEREYETDADGVERLVSVDMSKLEQTMGEMSKTHFAPFSYGLYRLPSGPTIKRGLENDEPWCTPERVAAPVKIHYDEWLRRGFAEDVYVYGIDEPVGEKMLQFVRDTYAIVKEQVPTCKIMQTGMIDKKELVGLVDIWCPKTTIADKPFFVERRNEGGILWDYVCVSPVPPYPNFFADEPAIDHRILFWQTRKIEATGLLYWTTISWKGLIPEEGETGFPDERFDLRDHHMFGSVWQHVNGDGLIVYPGPDAEPWPSIRLEAIRDGIEDFEYLALLAELTAELEQIDKYNKPEGRNVLAAARERCRVPDSIVSDMTTHTTDPEALLARREAVGDMIEQLVDILENKDHERYWHFATPTGDMG